MVSSYRDWLALAVVATIGVGASTSTAVFGPFNTDWDGTSELRTTVAADSDTTFELVRQPSAYDEYSTETVALVAAPERPYDEASSDALGQFVDRGGTLVVLESGTAHGDSLLEDIGATARIDGQLVRDEYQHADGPMMPIATAATDHTLTGEAEQITLNHASVVDIDGDGQHEGDVRVLFETSSFARLESDSASGPDSQPVATVESVGDGRVVAVSDPSLVSNAMVDRTDTNAFIQALSADADRVVFDVSHGESLPPVASALITVRTSPLLQVALGIAVILTVGLSTSQGVRRTGQALRTRVLEALASARFDGQSERHRLERSSTRMQRPRSQDTAERASGTTQNDTSGGHQ